MRFELLPRPLRQLAVVAVGCRNRPIRYGAEFRQFRRFLAESERWGSDAQEAWQLAELRRLLNSAVRGTAHYKSLSAKIDRAIQQKTLGATLAELPLLEKATLRSSPQTFENNEVRATLHTSTSGSTGSPMRVGHDRKSLQRRFALLADHLRWVDLNLSSRSVRLSGRVLCDPASEQRSPWLYNPCERQLFVSTYHLDDRHAAPLAAKLQDFQPAVLDGYPSAVLQLLRLISNEGLALRSLRAVITTAETLNDDIRAEIEALASVPVLDYYAASEGVSLIQQCANGTYHVRWQSGIFEILRDGAVHAEGDGELVCTSFVQERTPLIRYRTGDVVTGFLPPNDRCPCGLITPTIEAPSGRMEDLVYTTDGRALGMFTYRTLKFIGGLGEAQVIQEDYDRFTVRCVVPDPSHTERVKTDIKTSFERILGYPVSVTLDVVPGIPRGANGKLRLVISRVKPAR